MQTRKTWLTVFALATFVAGGMVLPVLHRVDHVSDLYEQQSDAHRHGDPASDAVNEACAEVAADLSHCHLCHRDFFSDLVPERTPSIHLRAETIDDAAINVIRAFSFAHYPIRAPPLKA